MGFEGAADLNSRSEAPRLADIFNLLDSSPSPAHANAEASKLEHICYCPVTNIVTLLREHCGSPSLS